ncbi:uncharacterized protein B0P05DRAFT_273729 [Gilbertella persicaria]|uniref:uncharacterized protein n=1 Tax=Gilbertella persicaria TaxID=101096 RepID=UPI00221F41CB|nr:uncharacterized protein B0P05DRAFT_273729 [Gilbertella persicaria]KAI8059033.1 hypothetical protein B0P05DRAFT_273729 [Gilbertella persicaria]
MVYIVEYAKSDRSTCSGPRKICPVEDRSIAVSLVLFNSQVLIRTHQKKGELRLGVEVSNIHGVSWRHWVCITDRVVENMKAAHEDVNELQGYSNLREEDQERIQRAWKLGKIPDLEKPEFFMEKKDKIETQEALDAEAEEEAEDMSDQDEGKVTSKKRHDNSDEMQDGNGHKRAKVEHAEKQKPTGTTKVHKSTVPTVPPHKTISKSSRRPSGSKNGQVLSHKPVKSSDRQSHANESKGPPPHEHVKSSPARIMNCPKETI